MVEFGFFALTLGLSLAVYGFAMGLLACFRPQTGIVLSARNALIGVNACVALGALIFWAALLSHDFSVQYVFRNSAIDMPPIYLFASFWSALEGSHLLWTLILTTAGTVALATIRPKNLPLLPGLITAIGFPYMFMLLLTVWASAPLTRMFPMGQFGRGMNALLQNPYMAAHPPSLFTGYCSLLVPFAYGMAALIRGSFTPEWLITVRRWTLAGWAVLTVGIFLGGKWAYVELGWAGYWAWDPVENSSFMPWLASTAALHTLLVLDKTNRLPRLAIFLSSAAFALTFIGTFITRSGVISSVHSFAESDIGPAYLAYICTLLVLALGMLSWRGHLLQGAARSNRWTLSKESSLLFTDFFLLFMLALVFIGTLLPLVVEALRGVKISIQQPFFNAFAPWIGVGLVALIGVGNLLRWRSGKIADPVSTLAFPALWALLLTASLAVRKELDPRSTIGFGLVLWSAGVLVMDGVVKLKTLRWNGSALLKYNRPYIGSWIVHMGFLVAVAGFLGGYRGVEAQATLPLHGSTDFHGYRITHEGLAYKQGSNVSLVNARLRAEDAKGNVVYIEPTRSKYTNSEEWLNEIGVHSTFWHDVYIALASFEVKDETVTLKMHINPTVKLVWTSLVLMVLGALIGLSHKLVRRSVDAPSGGGLELGVLTGSVEDILDEMNALRGGRNALSTPGALLTPRNTLLNAAIIAGFVGLTVFGLSGVALAQGAMGENPSAESLSMPAGSGAKPIPQILDPKLRAIGEQLRCPTCQGLSIVDSETPQSVAMRKEVARQLEGGASPEQIKAYFRDRYGEWILRQPDRGTVLGFWIWATPVAGLLLGPLALVFGLRRSRKEAESERVALRAEISQYLARLRAAEGGR